ncbi:uncharacterized protein [Palaemon carinicauda]|uniref:uncharacterized protein n=1 Tax=Palaemon carinicauda TaxID=392227 RepID=UPI0035B5DCD8
MERDTEVNLLQTVDDITDDWVLRLLNNREDHSGTRPVIHLRKWSKHGCPSKDALSGFSSSRDSIKIEYDLTNEDGSNQTVEETLVIKVLPSDKVMAKLLTDEKMHHVEVGQYKTFLKTLQTWERERKGPGKLAIMEELVPPHALAVSTNTHFTIAMPDLRYQGYEIMNFDLGLSEKQLLATAEKLGTYHGTGVAFKIITGINPGETFPQCFHEASVNSPAFTVFAAPCFEQFKKDWSQDPTKTDLLKKLQVYEDILVDFVVNNLKAKEPFATALHGDLQSSNMFFKEESNGEISLKLIDWATARYSQGTVDLAYLLNISVDTEIRRKATPKAIDMYFNAFNMALEDLGADISYPRSTFEKDLKMAMQNIVIWSIMCNNVFSTSEKMKKRLDAIVTDVLTNPDIELPTL